MKIYYLTIIVILSLVDFSFQYPFDLYIDARSADDINQKFSSSSSSQSLKKINIEFYTQEAIDAIVVLKDYDFPNLRILDIRFK